MKSIYEVLGKSVNQSKTHPKDPLKKLKIRLSVSKERGKSSDSTEPSACHEYVISAVTSSHDHPKKTRKGTFHIERCNSMTVNPPESLMDIDKLKPVLKERMPQMDGLDKVHMQKTVCKRCDHSRKLKQATLHDTPQRSPVHDAKGNYQCPKRMQTGPGDCNPPSPREADLYRVRDWLSKICEPQDGHELERIESRHRHSRKTRHHSCKQDTWERDYDLHRCPQYLDLATDHASYPYHVQSHACLLSNSPRQPRRPKQSKSPPATCKPPRDQSCPNRRTIVHQHHHHHSHHHYHHYVE